jgi:hypothetical protein
LINYLNEHSDINRSINFDDIVVKYRPWWRKTQIIVGWLFY